MYKESYEAIIVGGSYAGLSAAMALGRSLRNVLVIDSGLPCNRQTPHSHNFLTRDGEKPAAIASVALAQVKNYETVEFIYGLAAEGKRIESGFEILLDGGQRFTAGKLIFATGVKDHMPAIPGFAECWGISLIHCPYCHGYEVRNQRTAILANGPMALHYAQLIRHWTNDLTLLTNGTANLTDDERAKLSRFGIAIVESEIAAFEHQEGSLQNVLFADGTRTAWRAIYARPDITQHCPIPEQLGCELNEQGLIKVDMFQKTSQPDVFACGDTCIPMRSVAAAVASGNMAGAILNNELVVVN